MTEFLQGKFLFVFHKTKCDAGASILSPLLFEVCDNPDLAENITFQISKARFHLRTPRLDCVLLFARIHSVDVALKVSLQMGPKALNKPHKNRSSRREKVPRCLARGVAVTRLSKDAAGHLSEFIARRFGKDAGQGDGANSFSHMVSHDSGFFRRSHSGRYAGRLGGGCQ